MVTGLVRPVWGPPSPWFVDLGCGGCVSAIVWSVLRVGVGLVWAARRVSVGVGLCACLEGA